ncbi:MAG TPA: prephenate dehydrogenase/arogenate dehydrogenase family protein [Solirubrobacteraceae bacterium]|nr:prephenate dehydrogenase/arogenate dehydrogenase family protein [Solirubrobacteraceae bacterium]
MAVLGVGLIGGSIGLAARQRLGAHVVGLDADGSALLRAREIGAIDESAGDVGAAMSGADYAFVATPVGSVVHVAGTALSLAGPDCVVTDVGSTKRHIARELPDPRFVPGHPLAGAETAGIDGARPDLFDDAAWYLTPSGPDGAAALARVDALLSELGARPAVLAPDAHDRLMASVSHLPHVLANVLVAQAARSAPPANGDPRALQALGGNPSFRDATRVAGANTAIWTDIYLSNGDLLGEAIDEAIRELSGVRDAIDAEDAAALAAWNESAREQRARLSS